LIPLDALPDPATAVRDQTRAEDCACPTSPQQLLPLFLDAGYHNAAIRTERHEHCLKEKRGWF
jgi:hypothetical protein